MLTMQARDYAEINFEVVVATLEGFSKRGFSGDVSFTLKNRQPARDVNEVHHSSALNPPDFVFIVRQHHDSIKNWLALPDTILTVRFNSGQITKLQTRDRAAGVEVLP